MFFCEKILTRLYELDLSCDRDILMRDLRLYRQSISLVTAMADIAGIWSLEKVTGTLTDFADASVRVSLDWLLKNKSAQYGLDTPLTADQCQCVILGMGKYGARELNYSSDIDIVVFYEPDGIASLGEHKIAEFWIELTKDLSTILQSTTDAGFVFRVDLRLPALIWFHTLSGIPSCGRNLLRIFRSKLGAGRFHQSAPDCW